MGSHIDPGQGLRPRRRPPVRPPVPGDRQQHLPAQPRGAPDLFPGLRPHRRPLVHRRRSGRHRRRRDGPIMPNDPPPSPRGGRGARRSAEPGPLGPPGWARPPRTAVVGASSRDRSDPDPAWVPTGRGDEPPPGLSSRSANRRRSMTGASAQKGEGRGAAVRPRDRRSGTLAVFPGTPPRPPDGVDRRCPAAPRAFGWRCEVPHPDPTRTPAMMCCRPRIDRSAVDRQPTTGHGTPHR